MGMSAPTCAVPPLPSLIAVVALFLVLGYLTCHISGWTRLAERFRATEPFSGKSWAFQSARFREWFNFNGCLTVGASSECLYLAISPLIRILTPCAAPLLIPWREIEVQTGKAFFGWYDTALFRLGSQERVGVRIYGKLVNRLRQAAGPSWPLYHQEQMDAQTR